MPRDLTKDKVACEAAIAVILANWPSSNYTVLIDAFKLVVNSWPEAIERAIATEESVVYLKDQLRKYREMLNDSQCKTDMYKNELQIITTCRDHWKTSYEENKDRLATLTEEKAKLSAQVVALRESLAECVKWFESQEVKCGFSLAWVHGQQVSQEFSNWAQALWDKAKELNVSPDPGEKYRAVVDAAREFMSICTPPREGKKPNQQYLRLKQALAELDSP